jgi:uncharacterized membrane protein
MQSAEAQRSGSSVIHGNLRLARELEGGHSRRSLAVRVSDVITRGLGTLTCVSIHLVVLICWFVVNSGGFPWLKPFDPFPFGILTLIVSSEGVLLAIFVLISQNRMSRDADRRARLDLQVNLLTEQTATKILQILDRMLTAMNLPPEVQKDPDAATLAQPTNVKDLLRKLDESLGER